MYKDAFLLMWTKGDMTSNEVRDECSGGNWVPIVVMRMDEAVFVPCFGDRHTASRWAQRNLPKKSVWGVLNLVPELAERIDGKEWRLKVFDFPQKVADLVDLDIEVMECGEDSQVKVMN